MSSVNNSSLPFISISKQDSYYILKERDQDDFKCRMCRNTDFHCYQCKHRCHKKCPGHTHRYHNRNNSSRRSSSSSRIRTSKLSGDEHWTKVLQANDVAEKSYCRQHSSSSQVSSPQRCEFSPSSPKSYNANIKPATNSFLSQPKDSNFTSTNLNTNRESKEKNVFHALYVRFVNWIESNKLESSTIGNVSQTSTTITGSNIKGSSLCQPSDKDLNDNRISRTDSSLINKCDSLKSEKSTSIKHSTSLRDKHFFRSFSNRPSFKKISNNKKSYTSFNFKHVSKLSSSDSEQCSTADAGSDSSHWQRSYQSSTCSSIGVASPLTSPTTSDYSITTSVLSYFSDSCSPSYGNVDLNFDYTANHLSPYPTLFRNNSRPTFEPINPQKMDNQEQSHKKSDKLQKALLKTRSKSSSSSDSQKSSQINIPSTQIINCNNRRASFRSKQSINLALKSSFGSTNSTWPGKENAALEKNHLNLSEDLSTCTLLDNCEPYLKDILKDWNIAFTDIKIKDCVVKGLHNTIYRGKWHGDVLVYVYNTLSDTRMPNFLMEVNRLSKIRHENICLFMGACFRAGTVAIVTSELKGVSVYQKIHLAYDRLPTKTRIAIAKQVAQAVGYLHAKGITARKLNSKNIYFEPKVKLSLLDQTIPDINLSKRPNQICFPKGVLQYFAPEMLKTIKITQENSDFSDEDIFTTQTDAYAFGTLLFELLTGTLPMRGLLAEELIWQVISGRRQSLSHYNFNHVLKVLIKKCWLQDSQIRPSFLEINQELLLKTGLHKRHSSSQPEKLDSLSWR